MLGKKTALVARLVCLLALVLGMVPTWASEAVCVMPHREPVPMASCGMPCCAKAKAGMSKCDTVAPTAKPSCCSGPHGHAVQAAERTASTAHGGCRCETRVTVSVPTSPTLTSTSQVVPVVQIAILPTPLQAVVAATERAAEPGIVGTDSGPPPDPSLQEPPGRAPPTC